VSSIEVDPAKRVWVAAIGMQPVGALIAGAPYGRADAFVVLAVGVRELNARPAELVLDLGLRILDLSPELVIGEALQMRVRDPVRTDVEVSQLVPRHGRELVRIVVRELRDRERSAVTRVAAADEDLHRDAQRLQRREGGRGAAERVVERRADAANACKRPHLPQEQFGRKTKPVLPRRRNRVVAEDDRGGD
jgi:hypothetical protein